MAVRGPWIRLAQLPLTLTYQNFTHCSRPGRTREACRTRRMAEWPWPWPPAHLWPHTPSPRSHGFPAPLLTEEEGVTPPCKERSDEVMWGHRGICHVLGAQEGPSGPGSSDQDYLKGP